MRNSLYDASVCVCEVCSRIDIVCPDVFPICKIYESLYHFKRIHNEILYINHLRKLIFTSKFVTCTFIPVYIDLCQTEIR